MSDWPRPWRYLFHADLDAFYASVEQRDNPALRGRPVVVGGAPESRGVVAAASYEARAFGAHSAMPMVTALRLSPEIVRVPPHFDRYRQVSKQIMAIFGRVTPLVEPMSLDEAYLDVTDAATPDGLEALGTFIRRRVRRDTGLAITIGGGVTKTVAKIASQVGKPDGLQLVPPATEDTFLAPLDVALLSGVGAATLKTLHGKGIRTMGDLARANGDWLASAFGKRGPWLKERATGGGESEVSTERETKSISAETTMSRDTGDRDTLMSILREQASDVSASLDRHALRCRTVRVKLRLADFTTFTRQRTLPRPIGGGEEFLDAAIVLLDRELEPGRLFRLIGVGAAGLEPAFDNGEGQPAAAPAPKDVQLPLRGG